MVTPAGKEFLRNSINNAKFHNKILEENEMWRQWEIEQGLTMMVSDDAIRKKNKHWCKYHEKKKREKVEKRKSKIRDKKHIILASGRNTNTERWDHSGFSELYPEETSQNTSTNGKTCLNQERWDHSGFSELYPEETSPTSKASPDQKRWDHSGFSELYPEETSQNLLVNGKASLHRKRSKEDMSDSSANSGSDDDNEVWEDFKSYRRKKAASSDLKHCKSKISRSHKKRWYKKHCKSKEHKRKKCKRS